MNVVRGGPQLEMAGEISLAPERTTCHFRQEKMRDLAAAQLEDGSLAVAATSIIGSRVIAEPASGGHSSQACRRKAVITHKGGSHATIPWKSF